MEANGVSQIETERLKEIAAAVVDRDSDAPLGVYAFSASSLGSELARAVEAEVFLESFGNSAQQLHAEYSPYDWRSFFFCVIDHRRLIPAGAMRVVIPSERGARSKTFDDIQLHWGQEASALTCRNGLRIPIGEIWDIATLAVSRDYRGRATSGMVALGLYQAFTMTSQASGIDWNVAILDATAYRFANWHFKDTFAPFDGLDAAPYLGSASSIPVWCQLSDWQAKLFDHNRVLHDLVFEAVGFGPALKPLKIGQSMPIVYDIAAQGDQGQPVIDLRDPVGPAPKTTATSVIPLG